MKIVEVSGQAVVSQRYARLRTELRCCVGKVTEAVATGLVPVSLHVQQGYVDHLTRLRCNTATQASC